MVIYLLFPTGCILYLSGSFYIKTQERKQEVVTLDKKDTRALVFYRDDCADCQTVYPKLWLENACKKDKVFINLNQEKNRKYIATYHLTEVPTIIEKGTSHVGVKEIDQYMQE